MKAGGKPGRAAGVRIVLLGPPGSGKGTQAELASRRFGFPWISTGELLRRAVREESPLGRRVAAILEAGELVPDGLVAEVVEGDVRRRDPEAGFLLDGFPRTRPQVDLLDRILERLGRSLGAALLLEVGEAELLRRLSGRRVCGSCGAIFHLVFHPPRAEGRCDGCGRELTQREDDREAVVRRRLQVYETETAPVVDCYRDRGVLRRVSAHGEPEEVAVRVQEEILRVQP